MSPDADQKVHRDERHVPEDKEQEEVQGQEKPDRDALQEEHEGEVDRCATAQIDRVGDGHYEDERRHGGERQ